MVLDPLTPLEVAAVLTCRGGSNKFYDGDFVERICRSWLKQNEAIQAIKGLSEPLDDLKAKLALRGEDVTPFGLTVAVAVRSLQAALDTTEV